MLSGARVNRAIVYDTLVIGHVGGMSIQKKRRGRDLNWPGLPEAIKAGILTMVKAAGIGRP